MNSKQTLIIVSNCFFIDSLFGYADETRGSGLFYLSDRLRAFQLHRLDDHRQATIK